MFKRFSDLLISISVFAFALLMIEVPFYLFPSLIPQNLLFQMPLQKIIEVTGNDPRKIVERYDELPWLKFKPGVLVRDIVRNGEVKSFVSEWRTDGLGFKNSPDTLKSGKASIVLVGDSHAEGVGNGPKTTLTGHLVNKHNLSAYNMGVQGYGPQQNLAVIEKFALELKPKYILYMQNGSTFRRAYELSQGRTTGRISSRSNRDEMSATPAEEASWMDTSIFVAAFKLFRAKAEGTGRVQSISDTDTVSESNRDLTTIESLKEYLYDSMRIYLEPSQYDASSNQEQMIFKESLEIYESLLLKGKKLGEQHGFQFVVLVTGGSRSMLELPLGNEFEGRVANTVIELDLNANRRIIEFCKENNIPYIDAESEVRKYFRANFIDLKDNEVVDLNQLPYFKVDGHPTAVAQKIYADSVAKFLGQKENL